MLSRAARWPEVRSDTASLLSPPNFNTGDGSCLTILSVIDQPLTESIFETANFALRRPVRPQTFEPGSEIRRWRFAGRSALVGECSDLDRIIDLRERCQSVCRIAQQQNLRADSNDVNRVARVDSSPTEHINRFSRHSRHSERIAPLNDLRNAEHQYDHEPQRDQNRSETTGLILRVPGRVPIRQPQRRTRCQWSGRSVRRGCLPIAVRSSGQPDASGRQRRPRRFGGQSGRRQNDARHARGFLP